MSTNFPPEPEPSTIMGWESLHYGLWRRPVTGGYIYATSSKINGDLVLSPPIFVRRDDLFTAEDITHAIIRLEKLLDQRLPKPAKPVAKKKNP